MYARESQARAIELGEDGHPFFVATDSAEIAAAKAVALANGFFWLVRRPEDFEAHLEPTTPCLSFSPSDLKEEIQCLQGANVRVFSGTLIQAFHGLPFSVIWEEEHVVPSILAPSEDPLNPHLTRPDEPLCQVPAPEQLVMPNGDGPVYCQGEVTFSSAFGPADYKDPCKIDQPTYPPGPGTPDQSLCFGDINVCGEQLPPPSNDPSDYEVPPQDLCAGTNCTPTCQDLPCQEGPVHESLPIDTCFGVCDVATPPFEDSFVVQPLPMEPSGVFRMPIPPPAPEEDPFKYVAGTEAGPTQSIVGASEGQGDVPASTCNPVDLVYGYKQEIESDLVLALSGRDFSLVRHYSTNPWDLGGPGLWGSGWSSPQVRRLFYQGASGINPAQMFLFGIRPNLAVRFVADNSNWRVAGPGNDVLEYVNEIVPYYRLYSPGNGETHFFGGISDPKFGLLKTELDEFGNKWTYTYRVFASDRPRLHRIYLNGSSESDAEAVVEFGYYLHPEEETTNHPLQGRVARVIAFRFIGVGEFREPYETHRIDYTYKHNDDLLSPAMGSTGDLVQVVKYSRVDHSADDGLDRAFGPGYPHQVAVTQYRYHRAGVAAPPPTTGSDPLYGFDHTLKSVFRASQIEYYAERLYREADPATEVAGKSFTVRDAAYRLMLLPDDAVAFAEGSTLVRVDQVASKLVGYENDESELISTKVMRQYLLAGCGCSGSGLSIRQDFARESWTDGSSRPGRSTWLREFVLGIHVPEVWSLYRSRWIDSLQLAGSNAFRKTTEVLAEHDSDEEATILRQWITRIEYDSGYRVSAVYSPAACSGFTYSPATSSTAPSLSGSYTAGLARYFEYTSDHRVKEAGVLEFSGGSWSQRPQVEIDYPTIPGSNERVHLPTAIKRIVDGGAGAVGEELVTFEYEFYSGGNFGDSAVKAVRRTVELEQEVENGIDDAEATTHRVFDERGRLAWSVAADGVLTHIEYDDASGRTVAVTADAEYSNVPSGLESVVPEPTHTPAPITVTIERDALGRVRSMSVPGPGGNPITEQWVFEYRVIDRSLNDDPRQGVRYMTFTNFPPRVNETTYAGPGLVVSCNAQTLALSARRFLLNGTSSPSEYQFDPDDPESLLDVIDDTKEVGRRRTVSRLSGVIESVEVWHDVRGALLRPTDDRSYKETYSYDQLGRIVGMVTVQGDTIQLDYDVLGRVIGKRRGTSAGLALIGQLFYDSGGTTTSGVGNGNMTRAEVYTGESSGGTRVTLYNYDSRDRLVSVQNPTAPHSVVAYDNLDRVIAAATFAGTVPPTSVEEDTDRGRYVEVSRSQRGLVYRTRLAVNPADLEEGFLEWHRWFDPVGRVVASWGPDSPTSKAEYDSHGRVISVYATDRHEDARPGNAGSWDDAMSVEDDHVYEETHFTYDPDWGALTFVKHIVRAHSAGLAPGPLATSGTPTGVATYAGMMYDPIGRMIRRIDFGTNKAPGTDPLDDSFSNGTDPRTGSPALWPVTGEWDPEDYEAQIVTEVVYDRRGRVDATKDPLGRITRTAYDDLNQVIATIENAVAIEPSDIAWDSGEHRWRVLIPTAPDQDRVTSYAHFNLSGNWYFRQVAHIPYDGIGEDPDAAQITEYHFGVTTSGSLLNSKELVGEVRFPDRSTGLPGATAEYRVTHTYNQLGEPRSITDQNGTSHNYELDLLGRVVLDSVMFASSGPGADIDQTVTAIAAEYDQFGRLEHVKSLGGTGGTTVLDHVKFTHTPLWQIEDVIQDVDSEIGASGLDERTVTYEYAIEKFSANMMEFQGNKARLKHLHYPEVPSAASLATWLEFEYLSGSAVGNEVDDQIGRPSRLNMIDGDGSSWSSSLPLAEYGYVGLGMVSLVDLGLADVQLDRTIDSTGRRRYGTTTSQSAAVYPGWDRFGRVKRQMWVAGGYDVNTTPDPDVPNRREHAALAFGYDRNSNPTYRQNAQRGAGYGGRWGDRDWVYGYDGLDRLTLARRGVLSTSTTDLVTPEITDLGGGTYPPGSQKWTLDHLGNWASFAIDLNGDNDFLDGDEIQTRTPNKANELEAITPPSTGPPTTPPALAHLAAPLVPPFGFTHDHNGSRTLSKQLDGSGDGVGHKFIYDAWNRLVRIQRATVINDEPGTWFNLAEYRYNGLHWRTWKLAYDQPGEPEGQFRRYTYSAAWQPIVEEIDDDYGTFENTGTDRVAQQVWGIRGINDALFRREDRLTYVPEVPDPLDPENPLEPARYDPGPDGLFEKSFYQLTDPQFSVVALIDPDILHAPVVEQVEYDPYGRVRRTAIADFDHNGVVEVADIYANLAANFAADPSGDHDWNGTTDVQDIFTFLTLWFEGDATPRDQLSSDGRGAGGGHDNPIGYCGYYHDAETVGIMGAGNGGLYQVRHRVYDPHAGRWLQRDPAGFVDGMNLYEYCMGGPGAYTDPMGLDAIDDIIETGAGFADGLTFGLTYAIREAWNGNTVVDTSSANYQVAVGAGAATTVGLATFGVGSGAAAAAGFVGGSKLVAGGAVAGLYGDAAYQAAMNIFGRQAGYDARQGSMAAGLGGLSGPFMQALARMLGPLHPLFHRFATYILRINGDEAAGVAAGKAPVSGYTWNQVFQARYGAGNVTWTAPELADTPLTMGILRTPAGDFALASGWRGPAGMMPSGSRGFDIVTRTHVEGHAAAQMHRQGINEGTLYINNPSICPSCSRNLPYMLGPGKCMRVVTPGGIESPFNGVP
ncbi:MAG: hypothetical protein KF699_16830 [Phycisphaeraceae bacterium]|nr:hypothetical protein [Phycisphaeraceae bacterium]